MNQVAASRKDHHDHHQRKMCQADYTLVLRQGNCLPYPGYICHHVQVILMGQNLYIEIKHLVINASEMRRANQSDLTDCMKHYLSKNQKFPLLYFRLQIAFHGQDNRMKQVFASRKNHHDHHQKKMCQANYTP